MQMPSKKLVVIGLVISCLALWFSSLGLNALIFYDGDTHSGLQVLSYSAALLLLLLYPPLWLGIPGFAPWFANLLFWLSIFSVLIGSKRWSFTFALLACLLSMLTPFWWHFPKSAAGADYLVYGYGLGAVLWWASIFLLLLATAYRNGWVKNFRLALPLCSGVFIAIFGALAYVDRHNASPEEASFFSEHGVIFKLGRVCKETVNPPREQLKDIQVLELDSSSYEFKVEKLLDAGIPVVRLGDWDYFFQISNGRKVLVQRKPEGKPDAYLEYITSRRTRDRMKREKGEPYKQIKLTTSDGQVVFDQRWSPEIQNKPESRFFCPRFNRFDESDYPWKLVNEAFSLTPVDSLPYSSSATLIQQAEAEYSQSAEVLKIENKSMYENYNCRYNAGFIDFKTRNLLARADDRRYGSKDVTLGMTVSSGAGEYNLLYLKNNAVYPVDLRSPHASCSSDKMYVYNKTYNHEYDGAIFSISERSLNDFSESWFTVIKHPFDQSLKNPRLINFRYKDSKLHFDAIDMDTGVAFNVAVEGLIADGETASEDPGYTESLVRLSNIEEARKAVLEDADKKDRAVEKVEKSEMTATDRVRQSEINTRTEESHSLEKLEHMGLLRLAENYDHKAWENSGVPGFMESINRLPLRKYVVQGKARISDKTYGANAVIFYIAKGMQMPGGDIGHSTILDFNDFTCRGPLCRELNMPLRRIKNPVIRHPLLRQQDNTHVYEK